THAPAGARSPLAGVGAGEASSIDRASRPLSSAPSALLGSDAVRDAATLSADALGAAAREACASAPERPRPAALSDAGRARGRRALPAASSLSCPADTSAGGSV